MKRFRFHGLRIAAFGIVAVAVCGFVTTELWNSLLPAIFGLPHIGFFQALGLLLLSRLFFGHFPGRGRRGHGRFVSRWDHLTPEEKERFRNAMREKCGGQAAPAARDLAS